MELEEIEGRGAERWSISTPAGSPDKGMTVEAWSPRGNTATKRAHSSPSKSNQSSGYNRWMTGWDGEDSVGPGTHKAARLDRD